MSPARVITNPCHHGCDGLLRGLFATNVFEKLHYIGLVWQPKQGNTDMTNPVPSSGRCRMTLQDALADEKLRSAHTGEKKCVPITRGRRWGRHAAAIASMSKADVLVHRKAPDLQTVSSCANIFCLMSRDSKTAWGAKVNERADGR